jgi:eukaryotic-like serine/threonine-protein kinase
MSAHNEGEIFMESQSRIYSSTNEAYSVGRCIGRGAQGVVYEGHRVRDNQRVALKFGNGDGVAIARLRREAWAYQEFSDCQFIVDLLDHNLNTSSPFLVEEFCNMGSAREQLSFLQWNQRTTIGLLTHVCTALEVIQSRGCLYRDLKPDNLLVTKLNSSLFMKLADAGLICLPGEYGSALATRNALGTLEYMAPELFKSGAVYSQEAEVFALGVSGCEMLFGKRPPAGSIINAGPVQTRALLEQMIAVTPSARPTLARTKATLLSAYEQIGKQEDSALAIAGAGLLALIIAAIWKGRK